MVKLAIVGGTGYTGLELLRILAFHPEVEITALTSRGMAGQKVTDLYPALAGRLGGLDQLVFTEPDPAELTQKAEFFFTAVPHQTAMEIVPDLLAGGGRVVDLSADFRFNDPDIYSQWYQPHSAGELLSESVYGLPELHRDEIAKARLVGNPGCYTTSVILAAAPLVKYGLVDADKIIADSKSGVSGAGRGAKVSSLFCEVNDGICAYKVTGHRHTPEMEQELSLLAGRPLTLSFTPHLVPFSRGILSTVYAPLLPGIGQQDVVKALEDLYGDEIFIRLVPPGALPHTLDVRGTNFCDLAAFVDERTGWSKVVSVIDNLARGASGQAICCMNIMLGLAPETGLKALGLRP